MCLDVDGLSLSMRPYWHILAVILVTILTVISEEEAQVGRPYERKRTSDLGNKNIKTPDILLDCRSDTVYANWRESWPVGKTKLRNSSLYTIV